MNVCRKGENPFWLVAQVWESDCLDMNCNCLIYLLVFSDVTSLNLSFLFCQTGVISTHGVNLAACGGPKTGWKKISLEARRLRQQ